MTKSLWLSVTLRLAAQRSESSRIHWPQFYSFKYSRFLATTDAKHRKFFPDPKSKIRSNQEGRSMVLLVTHTSPLGLALKDLHATSSVATPGHCRVQPFSGQTLNLSLFPFFSALDVQTFNCCVPSCIQQSCMTFSKPEGAGRRGWELQC